MKFIFIIEMDMSGHLSNNLISSVVFFNKTAADWAGEGKHCQILILVIGLGAPSQ